MDELKKYLRFLSTDKARAEFASRCGTSIGYLRLIAYGSKPALPSMAVAIERESGGIVDAELLCPEKMDWAYLRQKYASDVSTICPPAAMLPP